jgi:hypothetical protein
LTDRRTAEQRDELAPPVDSDWCFFESIKMS